MSAPARDDTTGAVGIAGSSDSALTTFLKSEEAMLLGFMVVLVAFFTLRSENHLFWSKDVLTNILNDACPILLLAIGETFVIVSGGIDLSVGSNAAVSGVVAAITMRNLTSHNVGPYPTLLLGVLAAVAVGAGVGILNSLLINYAKLVAFVATLATLGICAGLAVVFTRGGPVGDGPRTEAIDFSVSHYWALSRAMIVVFAILIIAGLYLHRTRFGRYSFAIGSNPFAARAAGISLKRHIVKVYVLSGCLAGLAGMYFYLRLGSGSPSSGIGRELDAIAAVVIGGVALTGGVGSIGGIALGAIVLSTVASGLVLIHVQPNWRQVVVGALIAIAGAVQALRHVGERRA